MSLEIQEILMDESQMLAPEKINTNFKRVKAIIDKIEAKWALNSNKLKLVDELEPSTNGITANSIGLSATSGNALYVSPSGGSIVFSVDYRGYMILQKITSTSDQVSSFKKFAVTDESAFGGIVSVNGVLDLTGVESKTKQKVSNLAIISSNIGSTAIAPVDLGTFGKYAFLDCSNSGTNLNGSGTANIKLNVNNVALGQEFVIYVDKVNSFDKTGFYNGIAGSEVFAGLSLTGKDSIGYSVPIVHDGVTIGAFLKLVYTKLSNNSQRLLILDSKGFGL